MPLIEYLGNATPQDNTEAITLSPDPETGDPRILAIGGRALVSGDELHALAGNFQIQVIDDGDETKDATIPTDMPSGYDDDGYKDGEAPVAAVFTAEAYPDEPSDDDDEDSDATAQQASVATTDSPATSPLSSSQPSPGPATPVTPAATPSVTTPASTAGSTGASAPTSTPGASS